MATRVGLLEERVTSHDVAMVVVQRRAEGADEAMQGVQSRCGAPPRARSTSRRVTRSPRLPRRSAPRCRHKILQADVLDKLRGMKELLEETAPRVLAEALAQEVSGLKLRVEMQAASVDGACAPPARRRHRPARSPHALLARTLSGGGGRV